MQCAHLASVIGRWFRAALEAKLNGSLINGGINNALKHQKAPEYMRLRLTRL
jgi:hypothetical protein